MYREEEWPEKQYAPYQVRVVSALPGSTQAERLGEIVDQLIWIPKDNATNIRPFSDARWDRLQSLADLRDEGSLTGHEYAEERRKLIHEVEDDE